ncbi:MAG: hypothetical protein MI919_22405, partial [Holophagales bacterium]|nr:hypothetical protein [Holophagales bacterium]
VIVEASSDVSLFESAELVERKLEAVDVEADEYQAFDADGLPLQLTTVEYVVQDRPWYLGGRISRRAVKLLAPQSTGTEEELSASSAALSKLLKDFLERVGEDLEALEGLDLSEILEVAVTRLGYS